MSLDAAQIQAGLDLFQCLVHEDPELFAEFERSQRDFFRGASAEDPGAHGRHLEWFLFERLGGPRHELAVERLLPRWRAAADDELAESVDTFLSSHVGIFRVGKVEAGRGAWLSDLAGLGEYPVAEPAASAHLEEDDLVVGRLYGVGEGVHRASPSAQVFRHPDLADAIERDLERLREQRKHAVMRVAQIELESMFFGAGRSARVPDGGAMPGDPVGDARRLLTANGIDASRIEALLGVLAAAPFDPAALVHGVGDALGDVLDRLAFESPVDLDRARTALLLAWSVLSGPNPSAPKAPKAPKRSARTSPASKEAASDSVRAALARFADARRAGADLEGCFDELERDLGLAGDVEEQEDEEDVEELPDFPGVVGALIEEFVWQRGLEGVPTDPPEYEILRRLGGFAEEVGVIENFEPTQVVGFAALWLPDRVEFTDGSTAARAVRALRDFVDWLASEHAIELGETTVKTLTELERELPRVVEVNRRLVPTRVGPVEAESWFEVTAGESPGRPCLVGPGGLRAEVPLAEDVVALLAPGDWLRFELDAAGRSRPVRCFPAQASSWLAGRHTTDT